jgi:hypothetical protein
MPRNLTSRELEQHAALDEWQAETLRRDLAARGMRDPQQNPLCRPQLATKNMERETTSDRISSDDEIPV